MADRRKKNSERFAICINNGGYPASLEVHKVYPVVPDADAERDGDLRIIDESGEDYLYSASRFLVIELTRPAQGILRRSFRRQAS